MPVQRIAAWSVTLLTAGVIFTGGLAAQRPHLWLVPFVVISVLAPAVVGLLIANRQARNVVAWVLMLGALSIAPTDAVLIAHDHSWWALQWERASWPLLYAWPIAVAFVFPDGRLPSARWRPVVLATGFCFLGFLTVASSDPSKYDPPDQAVHNPISWQVPGWMVGVWVPLWLGILGSLFVGASAIRRRLRESTGVQRLQVLWLAWSAALIPLGLVWCGAFGLVAHFLTGGATDGRFAATLFPFLLVMETLVAVSVGVAVVRYRLYAIERLINRTIVYLLVTLVLAGAYAGVTLGLGVLLGRGSDWVTAAATLVVALAFRPLRGRVQDVVDRRFARQRYAGVRLVEQFEREVREGRRAPEEVGQVVAKALGDSRAELVFWLPASQSYAMATGEILASLPDDERAQSQIVREREHTGVLLHNRSLLDRPTLLQAILSAAALSVEIARLRVEVRRQLAEVEASRKRIVEAGYEERRRLERDLHDGAQQRLVTLGIVLRRLQRSLPSEARMLGPALDAAVDEVGAAVGDLRTIAAGVRPPRLDDGLAAALHDLARSAPVPVDVEASIGRIAASIEAAAYFVACEGLTNAVKHAAATKVQLRAFFDNGSLRVTVSDDGIGGAVARRGSGLSGLRDRVATYGGDLEIVSPEGRGTRLEVAIPCES
ncbi:MAG: sensor histidine kinase [Gaiellaceae bacterium]